MRGDRLLEFNSSAADIVELNLKHSGLQNYAVRSSPKLIKSCQPFPSAKQYEMLGYQYWIRFTQLWRNSPFVRILTFPSKYLHPSVVLTYHGDKLEWCKFYDRRKMQHIFVSRYNIQRGCNWGWSEVGEMDRRLLDCMVVHNRNSLSGQILDRSPTIGLVAIYAPRNTFPDSAVFEMHFKVTPFNGTTSSFHHPLFIKLEYESLFLRKM